MKKILIAFIIIAAFIIGAIYLFIPAKPEIVKNDFLKSNAGATIRILEDPATWPKWWPKQTDNKNQTTAAFHFDDIEFKLLNPYSNGASVSIVIDHLTVESTITVVEVNKDSSMLIWKCSLPESMQPIKRVQNYYRAQKIRTSMTGILNSLDNFLQQEDNIYGVHFDIGMSEDSTLVMTKGTTTSYPSEKYIYGMIGELKQYISQEKALETNHPMMDVKKISDQKYESMVAIPVNKVLPGKGSILFSRFVPWKVLTAEVKGGAKTVEEALRQMDLYISDHQLTRMAISFQSLVTNRMEQPDSTQWVTRIYTPVP